MKASLSISIALNVILLGIVIICTQKLFVGCDEIPNGKIGILNENLEIGYLGVSKKIFMLPKGLVVKDVSATGAGWFEPHRFRLVITSSKDNLVDYTSKKMTQLSNKSEYYSADTQNNNN